MRAWFMVGALILGLIGIWGEQGRTSRGGGPLGTTMEDPGPIPTPKAAAMEDPGPIPTPKAP